MDASPDFETHDFGNPFAPYRPTDARAVLYGADCSSDAFIRTGGDESAFECVERYMSIVDAFATLQARLDLIVSDRPEYAEQADRISAERHEYAEQEIRRALYEWSHGFFAWRQ